MWVVGPEVRSSGKAASALKSGAVSPVLHCLSQVVLCGAGENLVLGCLTSPATFRVWDVYFEYFIKCFHLPLAYAEDGFLNLNPPYPTPRLTTLETAYYSHLLLPDKK